MKKLFYILFTLLSFNLFSQTINTPTHRTFQSGIIVEDSLIIDYAGTADTLILWTLPLSGKVDTVDLATFRNLMRTGVTDTSIFSKYQGKTITRNFNTLEGETWTTFSEIFFPAEPLTASLTATFRGSTSGSNFIVQKSTAGIDNAIANWTVTRLSSSDTITTITIEGVAQNFTQPDTSASATGQYTLTFPINTNFTINLQATNPTGTVSDALSIYYRNSNYWGLASNNNPNDSEIQALTSALRTNRSETFSVSPSPEGYVVLAYPASYGDLSSLTVNGFGSLASFTQTTRSFTNESGYTESYHIYVSNNLYTSDSEIIAQ